MSLDSGAIVTVRKAIASRTAGGQRASAVQGVFVRVDTRRRQEVSEASNQVTLLPWDLYRRWSVLSIVPLFPFELCPLF